MQNVKDTIKELKTASVNNDDAKQLLEIVTLEFPNMLHYSESVNKAEIARYNMIAESMISDCELRHQLIIH